MGERRTRRLTDRELSARLNGGCPRCGDGQLRTRARSVVSRETGQRRFAGSFFGCSAFPACDYYVSLDGTESVREGDCPPVVQRGVP